MVVNSRVDLRVPYVEKEEAKALGARWDSQRRLWYAPAGLDLSLFGRWLPQTLGLLPSHESSEEPVSTEENGESLHDFLARIRAVVEGNLPQAAWVRAEISELRSRNGSYYLELAERNAQGDIRARAKAILWKSHATSVISKFQAATGEGLKTDIKILCLGKARFDPLYGFDLIIEDIDPAFTLGDLAAKLARIRERLQHERLIDRNRALSTPLEFVRVAVVSPETSAGLGDFLQETQRLEAANLCRFQLFPAVFQGVDAPSSIRRAVNEVLAAHRDQPFDALVLIRGGGSVTDLAWLNDWELARLLCLCPIPVFTGIGHERDSTILDEIAHRRFDTPSKVALHITTTIRDNARNALNALEQIRVQTARILSRERTALANQVRLIETTAHNMVANSARQQASQMRLILQSADARLRESRTALESCRQQVISQADQAILQARQGICQGSEQVSQRALLHIQQERSEVQQIAQTIHFQAEAAVQACQQQADRFQADLQRDTRRLIETAASQIADARTELEVNVSQTLEQASREIGAHVRLVVGMGPAATLQRGFAIARDESGRPITSRAEAARCPRFEVEFRDGRLPVANDSPAGDDPDER